jgi:hypothetical protein
MQEAAAVNYSGGKKLIKVIASNVEAKSCDPMQSPLFSLPFNPTVLLCRGPVSSVRFLAVLLHIGPVSAVRLFCCT